MRDQLVPVRAKPEVARNRLPRMTGTMMRVKREGNATVQGEFARRITACGYDHLQHRGKVLVLRGRLGLLEGIRLETGNVLGEVPPAAADRVRSTARKEVGA